MSTEGAVKRDTVITVLQTADASVAVDANKMTIVKDGIPEVYVLPEFVTRKLLARFANKYGVRIEWFYHPEMLHKASAADH